VDVRVGSGVCGWSAVVLWWGEAWVVGWGVGRMLELVVGSLGGRFGVLVVGWSVGRVLELVVDSLGVLFVGWGVGRVLELVVGSLGGCSGVLVEPSWIGRSLVR